MKNKELHWTFESEANLRTRIASDFLAQIEEKIAEKDWTHTEIAEALGVTEGRILQVFNNPGNLTLKTMMKMAEAVGLLVSVVAYNLGEKAPETGPVASGVFDSCWKKLGSPAIGSDVDRCGRDDLDALRSDLSCSIVPARTRNENIAILGACIALKVLASNKVSEISDYDIVEEIERGID